MSKLGLVPGLYNYTVRLHEHRKKAFHPRRCGAPPVELQACRRCALWERATQAVEGQGPAPAALMLVGEQPGDEQDLKGLLGNAYVSRFAPLVRQLPLHAVRRPQLPARKHAEKIARSKSDGDRSERTLAHVITS